jgi:hypothetical protein
MSRIVCFIDDNGQVATCIQDTTDSLPHCDGCEYNTDKHKKLQWSCDSRASSGVPEDMDM